MLIDDFMPAWDFVERHELVIAAPPETVYDQVLNVDLSSSKVIGGLLWLRTLPARIAGRGRQRPSRRYRLEDALDDGFVLLAEERPREMVLGTVGRFWRPSGNIRPVAAGEFKTFDEPNYARSAWNFTTEPQGDATLLRTETRVQCTDAEARKKFRRYWFVVRPFSGLIRMEMLRAIRPSATAG
ncbi:MAG: hypothetical protein WEB00_09240 [Dehalococcoidia bacterium]